MEDKCDKVWSEQQDIREYSPTYYVSTSWVKRLLKNKGGKLLDIGCGDCSRVQHFITDRIEYSGLDHSNVAIEESRKKGFKVYKQAIESFEFGYKFDIITAIYVMEHIKDDKKVIQQCYKNLQIGGTLLIITDINMHKWGPLDVECGHVRRYNPYDIIEMVKSCGFQIEQIRYLGFPLCDLYRKLQYFLGRGKEKYIPKGTKLKVSLKILNLILPIFKLDMLFSRGFIKYSRGIIILATKK